MVETGEKGKLGMDISKNSKLDECNQSINIGEALSQTAQDKSEGAIVEDKENLGEFLLENQINRFFENEEFKNFFNSLNKYGKKQAISLVIIYSIAFQDETKEMDYSDCLEFVKNCRNANSNEINYILANLICKKIGIKKGDIDYEQKLRDYIFDKIYKNGYLFHGFNSVFEDSIRKHGLSASIRFTADSEILEMGEIMEKYGHYFDMFYKVGKDSKHIYFDYDTRNIWMYANGSPEWFRLFIKRCFEDYEPKGWGNSEDGENHYDYNVIREKMQNFFKIKNVKNEDKIKISRFFEDNWEKYGNGEPRLAMIKKSALNVDEEPRKYMDLDTLILLMFSGVNCKVDKDISIDNVKIVKLPNKK